MCKWVMAVTAACVALVAAAARAETVQGEQVVLAPSVRVTHVVRSNAITAFGAACQGGYTAVSAGVTSPAPGTTVLAIAPAGLSAYRFRIANPAGNDDQRVTVSVACRKLGAPRITKYVLRLKPLQPRTVVVRPRKTVSAVLPCPKGTTPASGGFAFGSTALSVRRHAATLTAAAYTIANSGAKARKAVVYGGCLTLLRTADAPFEQLHLAVTTFRVPVQPGEQTLGRSCRRGWFAIAAGFSLRSAQTRAAGAAATSAGARWVLANDGDAAVLADVQLACGRIGASSGS
jgi:hypothetical protein